MVRLPSQMKLLGTLVPAWTHAESVAANQPATEAGVEKVVDAALDKLRAGLCAAICEHNGIPRSKKA